MSATRRRMGGASVGGDEDGVEDPGYALPVLVRRYQRARFPPPPRTTMAALVLLTIGTTLLVVGLAQGWSPKRKNRFILFLVGSITFLPGSYASLLLFGAFRRWPGYSYDHVPSWDD